MERDNTLKPGASISICKSSSIYISNLVGEIHSDNKLVKEDLAITDEQKDKWIETKFGRGFLEECKEVLIS